jgi:ABC-2 type transport system permease protein
MIRLVRAEFLKLRTTQVWFWLLLATIAISSLRAVAQLASRDGVRTAADVPDLFTSSAQADIVVFVLGVLGITTEFRYQTITPTVLQTPSRWTIVTAKMIAYALLGIGYAFVSVAAQLVVALPWLSAKNIDVDFGNSQVIHALVGVFGVVALYGIVGLGVGALLRNQVVAVVVGIIFLLILENVLLAIPVVRNAWPFTPGGATAGILHTTGSTDVTNGVHVLSTGGGVVVLLLWAFVPAILGAALTLNRDIT